jgi:hypothetical protein
VITARTKTKTCRLDAPLSATAVPYRSQGKDLSFGDLRFGDLRELAHIPPRATIAQIDANHHDVVMNVHTLTSIQEVLDAA